MDRINLILNNERYRLYIEKNRLAEAKRSFCHHNWEHFLDVARIAMLLNLEEGYGISKEMLYSAALLHDIGRWKQYEDGTPHEKTGGLLAPAILRECGFNEEETAQIAEAITNHRNGGIKENRDLSGLLYRADKLSRSCFFCEMEKECDWKNDKKNRKLVW